MQISLKYSRLIRTALTTCYFITMIIACSPLPTPSNDNASITFGVDEFSRRIYEPLAASFNAANPDIHASIVELSSNDYTVSSIVRKADTALISSIERKDIVSGALYSLSPFIESDPTFNKDDYYPGTFNPYIHQGNIYFLPQMVTAPLLVYNKEIWQEAGLETPRDDWSWSQFRAALIKIAQSEHVGKKVYGFADGNDGFDTLIAEMAERGFKPFNVSAQELHLDQPVVASSLSKVYDLAKMGAVYVAKMAAPDVNTSLDQMILDQRIGVWFAQYVGIDEYPFDVGIMPLPPIPLPAHDIIQSHQGFVMSAGTRNPEKAWRWLAFLSKQPTNATFLGHPSNIILPARQSLAANDTTFSDLDPADKVTIEAALSHRAAALPISQFSGPTYGAISRALDHVVSGEAMNQALADAEIYMHDEIAKQPPEEQVPSQPVVNTPIPEKISPETMRIVFSVHEFTGDIMDRAVKIFHEQHPEVIVEVRYTRNTRFAELAQSSDCFLSVGNPSADEIQQVLDIQPLIDADPRFQISDYPQGFLIPFRQGAELKGIPYSALLRVIAYNPELFQALGVDPPSPSWSMEDFFRAAQKVTERAEATGTYGFAGANPTVASFFLDRFHVVTVNDQDGEVFPDFNNPKLYQALRYYGDVLAVASPHKRFESYSNTAPQDSSLQMIAQDRIAMWVDFFDGKHTMLADAQAIAPPMLDATGVSLDDFQVTGMYISRGSPNPTGCWAFMKFLSQQIPTRGVPVRLSLLRSSLSEQSTVSGSDIVYNSYIEAIDINHARSITPQSRYYTRMNHLWLFQAIDESIQGKDLAGELAQAQTATEQFIRCTKQERDLSNCTQGR